MTQASTFAEQAELARRDLAYSEAQARDWLAELQRPIKAKGKRIALEHYSRYQDQVARLRDALARLTRLAATDQAEAV